MTTTDQADDRNTMMAVLNRQRAAFLRDGTPDLALRKDRLLRLRRVILPHRRDLAQAISDDFGNRSRHETDLLGLVVVVQATDYLHRNLRHFMRPERRHVDLVYRTGRVWIAYQPKDVIGVVAPWTAPSR